MTKKQKHRGSSTSQPPQVLSDVEAETLIQNLRTDCLMGKDGLDAFRNQMIGLLMLDAGLRVGEVVTLTISQLWLCNEPSKAVRVSAHLTKTGVTRTVPLSTRLQELARQMWSFLWYKDGKGPTDYAFYGNTKDKHISVRQVERIIKRVSLNCIGRPVHPHILRHTFATRLMRTASTRVVQELLGHKSLQSTQVYTHPNSEDLRNAIDSLNRNSQKTSQET